MIKLKKLLLSEDAADDLQATFTDDSLSQFVPDLAKVLAIEQDPKVQAVLKAGQDDGDPDDDKLPHTVTNLKVGDLIPTQQEIGFNQSIETLLDDRHGSVPSILGPETAFVGGPIVTYDGKYVIDGHHRWSQVLAANPESEIPSYDIAKKPGMDENDILKAVHGAVAAELGKVPSEDFVGTNILDGVNPNEVETAVDKITPKGEKSWSEGKPEFGQGEELKQNLTNHLTSNLEKIKATGGKSVGPKRLYMPQTDADDTKSQPKLDALARGDINIAAPFKKESKVIKLKDLLAEGKYDHHIGRWFDVNGRDWRIVRFIDDRFAHVMDDRKNSSMFRIEFLVKNAKALKPGGPDFSTKKQRPVRPKVMTKRDYEKMLKGAMEDTKGMMGDEEFTHDMASSMIHDPEIKKLLQKEYPMVRKEEDLIQRLQWDLETYD
jgi:hypothetical protein